MALITGFAYGARGVSARWQQIEENYRNGITKVYEEAVRYARRLSIAERLLWTELISGKKTPYSDSFSWPIGTEYKGSIRSPYFGSFALYLRSARLTTLNRAERNLRVSLRESYSLHTIATFLLDEGAYQLLTDVSKSKGQDIKLRRQARSMLRKMEVLQEKVRYLENQRQNELAKLKRSPKPPVAVEYKTVTQQPEAQLGVVSAICHSKDGAMCMVDGVDEMLKAGDTIQTEEIKGIKVVNISADKVKFSRKGKTWQQALGKEADSAWGK